MEPTYMPTEHSDADAVMSCRVCGQHHPAANEYMPKSIWQPGVVRRLADYIKQLRQSDHEPVKPDVASDQHSCPRHPERACNCPAGACADDDVNDRYTQRVTDFYTCPISGTICLSVKCREWCESGVDRTKT